MGDYDPMIPPDRTVDQGVEGRRWTIYVCPGCNTVSLSPRVHYGGHAKNAGEHYVASCYDEASRGEWFVDEDVRRDFERIDVAPVPDRAAVERAARALNDEWAAGSQGARWPDLEDVEREHWREAARVALTAAGRTEEASA